MHMSPLEPTTLRCPDCNYGVIDDRVCETCGGIGRLIIGAPRYRPVMSRRATNLVIGISIVMLALLLSWWVIS